MPWSKLSRQARGYGAAWEKLREQVLQRDKFLCQLCKQKGRVTVGNEVDHITPKAKGGTDDMANLMLTCHECHLEKSSRDRGVIPKKTIGVDGWPIA